MQQFLQTQRDVWIAYISVIIQKKEDLSFRFRNNRREESGLVFILGGQGCLETEGRPVYLLEPGDVLLLEQESRYVISSRSEEFQYITTAFQTYPVHAFQQMHLPTVIATANTPSVLQKARQMLLVWENRSSLYLMQTRLLLSEILMELIQLSDREQVGYGADKRLYPALTYIHQHYDSHMTLESLAAECHMSPSHFRKLFSQAFGISPMKYRDNLRLDWAFRYLENNILTVAEIADRLGFYDIYHFSKDFKKMTGQSPTQYRKALFTK